MIRPATPDDVPIIADLIRALAEYEKVSHRVTLDEKRLHEHLFGRHPFAEVLLAEIDGALPRGGTFATCRPKRDGEPGAINSGPGGTDGNPGATNGEPGALATRGIAGFALFFHNYSTFQAQPGIYLEDLFVRPEFRGHGYGKALLAGLAKLALKRGCCRLEWSVLNWNKPALGFYRYLGAKPMDEWTVYRLYGTELEQLAKTC